jgi:hypothetical protein
MAPHSAAQPPVPGVILSCIENLESKIANLQPNGSAHFGVTASETGSQ